ncbi:MAG: TIGR02646 family protein [Alphaproteobacteria bacterium]|nr:TIGR02646 family protein [Alphaproteobacteria bacterium]
MLKVSHPRRPGPSRLFKWPKLAGRSLAEHLEAPLQAMTDEHCAYCDGYPTNGLATRTIDHFRPKSTFPELAFDWTNLYPACNACQERRDAWDDGLIAPDAPDYSFSRFFLYDPHTGEVRVNLCASPADQARAKVTIRLFRLNQDGRPRHRLRMHERWRACRHDPALNDPIDWPYRFALLANEPASND